LGRSFVSAVDGHFSVIVLAATDGGHRFDFSIATATSTGRMKRMKRERDDGKRQRAKRRVR
jgi:hypothetical protein